MKKCTKCNQTKDLSGFYHWEGKPVAMCKACKIAYRKSIQERSNARRRERLKTDPIYAEKIRRYKREEFAKKTPSKLFYTSKAAAKKRNLDFDIEMSDIVIPELCPILQKPIKIKTRYAPSVDRIDNSKGYVKGNVWVISKQANTMKNSGSLGELVDFCTNLPRELARMEKI